MKITDILDIRDLGEPYDRLSDFLELDEIIKLEQAYGGRQIKFRKNCGDVTAEYPELVATVGIAKAAKVVKIFGGMPTYFPTLKRSCKEKIKSLIFTEFNGYNYLHLARKFGYSERHIRHILAKSGKRRNLVDKEQLSLFDIPAQQNV